MVISVDMRFFRNAARKNFQMSFYRAYVTCIQFAVADLQRARPKNVFEATTFEQKKRCKDEVRCS